MTAWHTNLCSVYHRQPLTIGEAVEVHINDAEGMREGSIESVRARQDAIMQVLKVMCDLVLTDQQEQALAKALGFKEAK